MHTDNDYPLIAAAHHVETARAREDLALTYRGHRLESARLLRDTANIEWVCAVVGFLQAFGCAR